MCKKEELRKRIKDAIEVSKRMGLEYEALLRSLDEVEHRPDDAHEKPPPS